MTLHSQPIASAPATTRSGTFRLKALFSERRARESIDPRSKHDWEELAIEWHMMANLATSTDGEPHEKQTPDASEHGDAWVKSFIRRLSGIVNGIGGKKSS